MTSLLSILLFAAAQTPAAKPATTKVAEGIYLFQTAPYGDVGLDGNSVAILSDDGVLVFDANGTPAASAAVLAEIRALTDKPVKYLVYSHWHWDHWYGGETYKKAFPNINIIAHEKARELMLGPAIEFNRPGLEEHLPAHVKAVEDAAKGARDLKPAEAARLDAHAAADRAFLDAKRGVALAQPNITYTGELTLHLGKRTIRIMHVDRAVTPGDSFLYLPGDKIVIAGDLLIQPITFALYCYPSGWIRTLEAVDRLDASMIIPGHGAPLRCKEHLRNTLALLKREQAIVAEAAKADAGALSVAAAADPEVLSLRSKITGGDPALDAAFRLYLIDWFIQRACAERSAPLGDDIPPLK